MRLGIDFGTTRTVVAVGDRGNYPVVGFLDGAGDSIDWFPSLVAGRGGELRFGWEALEAAHEPGGGWELCRSFKRLLTGPDAAPHRVVELGGARLPVGELLTRYLTALKAALFERSNIGRRDAAGEPLEAAVAVPANAHGTQRFLTLDAFQRAGFRVVALLNEPSAAGFEYTHRHRDTITSRRDHIVVYDLGGGTFDCSLVRMSGRHHEAVTTAGLAQLGGDDFDRVLAGLLAEGAPSDRLLERCREAKEALTPNSRKLVVELDDGATASVSVADYYAACAPLIARSIDAMTPVMRRLDELDGSALAGIYVVGGASALPAVGRELRERFGRRVHRSPYPFAAVAIGLAIAADPEAGFALSDRFSRNFGVFREARGGDAISFDPIFTREMTGGDLDYRRTYRARHNLGHFRFVECSAIDAAGAPAGDLTPSGEVRFPFDPALRVDGTELDRVAVRRGDADGPLIEERYAVDAHGIVEIRIVDLDTGYARAFRIGA